MHLPVPVPVVTSYYSCGLPWPKPPPPPPESSAAASDLYLACLDCHDVSEPDSEVVAHHPVHPDLLVSDGVVGQHDANTLLPLLALQTFKLCNPELFDLAEKNEEGGEEDA